MSSVGGLMVPAAPTAPVQSQTSAMTVITRILDMIKRDVRFTDFKNHYSSYERSMVFPHVFAIVESCSTQAIGIGRIREEFNINVSLARGSPNKADAEVLYKDFENLRSLLQERPRLEDLENVDLAECTGMTPTFGDLNGYLVSSADVKVKVKMHKVG